MSNVRLGRCVIGVDDEDAALEFYGGALGFTTLIDETRPTGIRLVHVGTDGIRDPGLWLLRGGCVRPGPAAVLYTDELEVTLERALAHGGHLHRGPAGDGDSRFAHVLDPSGNELILVQLGGLASRAV